MKRRKDTETPYYRQRFLCSAGEFRFCRELQRAVGDEFVVMFKVRVAALLRCDAAEWDTWGRRVSQKEFDFVLVEPGTSFAAAAIELDDKTHDRRDRRARDRFLETACARAGLPLVRFRVRRRYDRSELRQAVLEAIQGDESARLDYRSRSVRQIRGGERCSKPDSPSMAPAQRVRTRTRPRGRIARSSARPLRRHRR